MYLRLQLKSKSNNAENESILSYTYNDGIVVTKIRLFHYNDKPRLNINLELRTYQLLTIILYSNMSIENISHHRLYFVRPIHLKTLRTYEDEVLNTIYDLKRRVRAEFYGFSVLEEIGKELGVFFNGIRKMTPSFHCVLFISKVRPGSYASNVGIKQKDCILCINNLRVARSSEFLDQLVRSLIDLSVQSKSCADNEDFAWRFMIAEVHCLQSRSEDNFSETGSGVVKIPSITTLNLQRICCRAIQASFEEENFVSLCLKFRIPQMIKSMVIEEYDWAKLFRN